MSQFPTVRWEDYIISGERAQEAADCIEAFAASIVFDPDDRLYPSEDYIGNIGQKVPEVEEAYGVTFTIDF
jgi:hypothetical protein